MILGHRTHAALIRTFGPGPECIPIERLGDVLSTTNRAHVEGCTRCQTELALWREFDEPAPSADEGAAVQWVAAELGRRLGPPSRRAPAELWRCLKVRRLAPAAGALALAAAVGYAVWDPEPGVRTVQGAPAVYRTARLDAIAPLGDIAAPPRAMEWAAFNGATVYEIEVFEVDRSSLWRGSSSAPRVQIPSSLSAHCSPGKTVFWQVTARNAAGVVVADSGALRFRVSTQPTIKK